MKKEEKEIIVAFLGETLNLPTETVSSLFEKKDGEEDETLKADAKSILLAADVSRIDALKAKAKTEKENAYSKAKAEVLDKFETEFKAKFGVDSDKKGMELLEEFVSSKVDADGKLTADKLKIHPEFLKLEKEWSKAAKAEAEALKLELENFKKETAKKETFSSIAKKADETLTNLKPILSKDAVKAANQKRLLIDELKGFEFQENEGEVIVMKDGKRYEDGHGKAISFETLVKETAGKYWDFEDGGHHSGSGAGQAKPGAKPAAGTDGKWTGKVPANDDEYSAVFVTLKTGSERAALDAAYTESKAVKQT